MSNKYNLFAFLGIVVLILVVGISLVYLFLQKQYLIKGAPINSQNVTQPPAPVIPDFNQQTYTGTVTFDDCGTLNDKSPFSITLPSKWYAQKTDSPEKYQNYSLYGPEGSIYITCFKDFTPDVCKQDYLLKDITIGSQTTEACLFENGNQIKFEFADVKSPQNNTFNFNANATNKEVLNQILASFKFN